MFKVDLADSGYNKMHFIFESLESAQAFVKVVMNSVDSRTTKDLEATISFFEEYKNDKEGK